MPTFMQAVERLREREQAPLEGAVCLRGLTQQLGTPDGCLRSVQSKALEPIAVRSPWAVILCRYLGEQPNPALEQPVEDFYRRAFSPGTGGLVEYWRDATLGVIDLTGSVVFDWVELEIPLSQAGQGMRNPDGSYTGPRRAQTVDYAINAVRRGNQDPVSGFQGQIAVITRNWSIGGVMGSPDWNNPNDPLQRFYQFWIDGSASGNKTTLTPPHNGNIAAHEMGHGVGLSHDVGADLVAEYADPCCIMSGSNPFVPPSWDRIFGPAICLPHLVQHGWMFSRRLYSDDGSWISQPNGITLPLSPLTDPGARANLGLKLPFARDGKAWDYYVEYVKPTGWDRGLPKPYVFIRRIVGATPAILGSIAVPEMPGASVSFLEVSGNVAFGVQRFDALGRILKVTAKKL